MGDQNLPLFAVAMFAVSSMAKRLLFRQSGSVTARSKPFCFAWKVHLFVFRPQNVLSATSGSCTTGENALSPVRALP
jgi:hypothetical protein